MDEDEQSSADAPPPVGPASRPRPRPRPAPVERAVPVPRPRPSVATPPQAPEPADAPPPPLRRAVPEQSSAHLTTIVDASQPRIEDEAEQPAGVEARRTSRRTPRQWRSLGLRSLIVLVVAVTVAVLLRTYVVEQYYIPSQSMEPTLVGCPSCTDDHVLVDKLSYHFRSIQAGDVVVFHRPPNAPDISDSTLIKRVIAVGGDQVQLRKNAAGQWDGKVYVNGLALEESYVNKNCPAPITRPLTQTTSWTVPKGDVFVMGDNRCESDDSRVFGPIKDSLIIGRAVLIIWPLNRFGGI